MPTHRYPVSFAMMEPAFLRSIVEPGDHAGPAPAALGGVAAAAGHARTVWAWLAAHCRPAR